MSGAMTRRTALGLNLDPLLHLRALTVGMQYELVMHKGRTTGPDETQAGRTLVTRDADLEFTNTLGVGAERSAKANRAAAHLLAPDKPGCPLRVPSYVSQQDRKCPLP